VEDSELKNIHRYALYVVTLGSFFLPTYTELPIYNQEDVPLVIKEVLMAMTETSSQVAPIIHALFVVILLLLYLRGGKYGRVGDLFFAAIFLFVALTNSIAMTEHYGLTILTGNLVPMLIVAAFWFWEVYEPRNVYRFPRAPLWRYWVVPFAILAFWFPISETLSPDFNPLLLITSDFGITFCPTTPFVLALLAIIYPSVNRETLRFTSLVGLVFGLFNVMSLFIIPGYTLWMLFLHIPLILISSYGLAIPHIVRETNEEQGSNLIPAHV